MLRERCVSCGVVLAASLLCALPLRGSGAEPNAQEPSSREVTYYRIGNRWLKDQYLYDAGTQLKYGKGNGDAYLWSLEDLDGCVRIRNKATGDYVNISNDRGRVECTDIDGNHESAQWKIEVLGRLMISLQAKSNNAFLNVEKMLGHPTCDLKNNPGGDNWWSAQWKLTHVSGPAPPRRLAGWRPNTVYVESPDYRSKIRGETAVTFTAEGMTEAEATCWHQPTDENPNPYGYDCKLAAGIQLDADAKGSFVFLADEFPHGPVNIRILARNATQKDTCFLQLYNEGGMVWNQGVPESAPPPARGMKLVFADDFDKALSFSRTGYGATYCSHKPGGGDFSAVPFANFEAEKNPFLQVDSYLRIRGSRKLNSTGLISSLRMDGTGITANVPCYFECRLTAQSAPGSWPAFWLMTRSVCKGLKEPADELDIVEAYGGYGPRNPNQTGYWIVTHFWNQGAEGKKQKGISKQVAMTELGGGASWATTFHVYGCKIAESDTIYYFDNIEVGRHPTGRLSKSEPWFFFVNLAIGGNGWPINLERYDDEIDMYVDYVRVYQQ